MIESSAGERNVLGSQNSQNYVVIAYAENVGNKYGNVLERC